MEIFSGKGVCGGIAIGNIYYHEDSLTGIKRMHIESCEEELSRLEEAKKTAVSQLRELYDKALLEVGETNAQIFDIHAMMLEDPDYNESVRNIITVQNVNAEYAVSVTSENFSAMFREMNDEYMKARAVDVTDISNRLINALSGRKSEFEIPPSTLLFAHDLTPGETVQLDKKNVIAFVTEAGSVNSHTAILARTLGVPAIIGAGVDFRKYDGTFAAIDGGSGKIYISPDEETLHALHEKLEDEKKRHSLIKEYHGRETVTKSGRKINLYANIGGAHDIGAALLNDAEGIGLLRSEFLYLESKDFPSEQEQFSVYKKIVESMGGKRVIIRTLDIGADKRIGYFNLENEENPAMGMRAIRICLRRTDVFKTQLRAILRASAYGKAAIMFPMIISLDEIHAIKEILNEVMQALRSEGIAFDEDIETGIMIETPAAALISDLLAKEVDFFSIGSNDLTQYTLAIDRQNESLDSFYDPYHEGLKRLIEFTVKNAHENGIWAGICGELGGDTEMTKWLISIGIDEISVSPPLILPLRKEISNCE